jgi:ubiquinone biosynthesis protein COQ4
MATQAPEPFNPGIPMKREWGTAPRALRRLLSNGDDTEQVFRIMRALNGDVTQKNYRKLLTVPERRQARLSPARTGRAALGPQLDRRLRRRHGRRGLSQLPRRHRLYRQRAREEVSMNAIGVEAWTVEHPYAWMGRRERDIHDLWHVLTGYKADEHLGEACLVAFSYAQTGGLGWAFIAAGAALKSIRITGKLDFLRAVIEGYRHGRRAGWLHGEDYEALLAEPIDVRSRLEHRRAAAKYRVAQASLAEAGLTGI